MVSAVPILCPCVQLRRESPESAFHYSGVVRWAPRPRGGQHVDYASLDKLCQVLSNGAQLWYLHISLPRSARDFLGQVFDKETRIKARGSRRDLQLIFPAKEAIGEPT